ncbi:MAG: hypothetical protein RQ753_03435 [Desulfurivibrionaceae bacterium]|nr:hypothetical protein [Desulfobulbales bacterium]MDT8334727.1 hypothetical protein [Desulfurivibrionaceae bacterium]
MAPIKLPDSSPSMVVVNGVKISATAFVDRDEAADAFGFDIRKAGILPVQLTFQNESGRPVHINPGQTFLVDKNSNAWPILSLEKTYQRTSKYVKIGESAKGAATPAILMGAAGAIAGLAIGIVSGENIGESMGKGAVLGAAGGAIVGGADATARSAKKIRDDLTEKTLRNQPIKPGHIAYGALFFPGTLGSEAGSVRQLRLALIFGQAAEEVAIIDLEGSSNKKYRD